MMVLAGISISTQVNSRSLTESLLGKDRVHSAKKVGVSEDSNHVVTFPSYLPRT